VRQTATLADARAWPISGEDVVDVEDADAVVLEFDFGDGGVDGNGVLGVSGGGGEKRTRANKAG